MIDDELQGVIILASRETNEINLDSLQPFRSLAELVQTKLSKLETQAANQILLQNLLLQTNFTEQILNESVAQKLYPMIHDQVNRIIGEVDFYIALYDSKTERIEIPYLYEGGEPLSIDPFPLGEGLSSIVIRTRQPLMLVENTEERAKALGAKIVGDTAKSWLGVPLLIGEEVIGILNVQDVRDEKRFSQKDLELLERLAAPIAGAIHSANLLEEAQKRTYQLETTAEIAREASTTLEQDELLRYTLQLVQDRFEFYHASIFLIDSSGEFAVVQESTGEAGAKMKADGHKLAVGSQSIIGNVTANKKPLVVNDVKADPTHKFNPLLPDTRAELGIPIMLGEKVLGALDVQSTTPYAFSPNEIEVLQIFANQLAVAINNAALFSVTQENLAQHRLIHHITTVAASAASIEDAISGAVQGLRVTIGDYVSILLLDTKTNMLRVQASAGYDNEIDGVEIPIGEGITGLAAQNTETIVVNNVSADDRYVPGKEGIQSEMAIPLVYRNETLGVLNVESENLNAFDEHYEDILNTLANSLSAVIINARLADRQKNLFDVTTKIRQSVDMETILETTATELTKALQARKARIQVGGDLVKLGGSTNGNEQKQPDSPNKEGQA
jgi:GAF domain-containing protein